MRHGSGPHNAGITSGDEKGSSLVACKPASLTAASTSVSIRI